MTKNILFAALALGIGLTPVSNAQEFAPTQMETEMTKAQHSEWTTLLSKYVKSSDDGINRFDYGGLKANTADVAKLTAYIDSFADMDFDAMSDDETFAAWSNLYNAGTIQYILFKYPTKSIKAGYYFGGPWKSIKMNADGRKVSLDDIEHKILRPMGDNRVHYAVNCASYGCPNLQKKAWEVDTLDADLDAAAREYINHSRGITVTNRGLTVSEIYDWFEVDFGGSKDGVIKHLLKYADADLKAQIEANPKIRSYDYDWDLNGTDS